MNRVALAVALLAASFALQHYADKKIEAMATLLRHPDHAAGGNHARDAA